MRIVPPLLSPPCSLRLLFALITFSTDPDAFHNVLQNGPELDILRRLLRDDGLTLRDDNGVYMFVPAKFQASIRQRIQTDRLILGGAHVIVPEDVEDMILMPLMALPREHKISVSKRELLFASATMWAPKLMRHSE